MDARGSTNTLVAALLASFIVLLAPSMYNAVAGEIVDGSVPANGLPQAGDVGATWNGSTHKVLRSDASGILRVTEEYPYQLQTEVYVAGTNIPVHQGLKQLGNGWAVHPNGDRVVKLRRTTTGGTGSGVVRLFLYGSDDNVNFYPLMPASVWSAANAIGDSTRTDTLSCLIPSAGTAGVAEFKITLPSSDVYPGRYLSLWGWRDSSASSVTTLSITFEGRYK